MKKFIVMCAVVAVALTACGGGSSGADGATQSRVSKLLGKLYAKVIGDKIAVIRGSINEIADGAAEFAGTFEVDGDIYPFKTPVGESGDFTSGFSRNVGSTNTISARGSIFGKVVQNSGAAPEPQSIVGTWSADLPTPGGTPGQTTRYSGTVVQSNSLIDTTSATPTCTSPQILNSAGTACVNASGGTSGTAGSCEWSPTSFYNELEVVSYQGETFTAKKSIVPIGAAGATIFNPAVNSLSWNKGGTCGPTPFVKVLNANCVKGTDVSVITMNGTALGGGKGDALAAYTNNTDSSYSNENNFGLPGTNYSMTCTGGGMNGTFRSNTSPGYSVCVKTDVSNEPTQWSSTQTIPNSNFTSPISTAYVSKGNPLLATVFGVGAIVLGLDAVRSPGVAMTGNCN